MWIRRIIEARGIQIIQWPDGSLGLLNVPAKYVGLISDFTAGLAALDAGDSLPELIDRPKKKGRRRPSEEKRDGGGR